MRFDNKVAAITGGGRWDPGLQHIPVGRSGEGAAAIQCLPPAGP